VAFSDGGSSPTTGRRVMLALQAITRRAAIADINV
jgi:hypothetical protein